MNRVIIGLLTATLVIGLFVSIPQPSMVSAGQTAEDLFNMINDYRTSQGLAKIVWHTKCYTIAYNHTQNMHNTSQLSHELNGKGADDRLDDAGIEWSCYVENIAFNHRLPDPVRSAFDQWKASKGHRENMLSDCIVSGAVAIVSSEEKGHYFTFLAIDSSEGDEGDQQNSSDLIKHTMSPNEQSPTYTMTLQNTGKIDLNYTWKIDYKNDSNWIVVSPGSNSIVPGESCEFTLHFTPTHLTDGLYKADIIFNSEAGTHTVYVELTIATDGKGTVELWIGSDIMRVNGQTIRLDAPPQIVEGRTLVPVRVISEAFGADVGWEGEERKVTVSLGSNHIEMWIDSSTAFVGGTKVTLEPPPTIISGRTFVPFRFIGEALGGTVQWDADERKVTITIS